MGTVATPLDLKQNVVLERFELSAKITNLSLAHRWIHQTLQSITSPVFNEFVIWVLDFGYPVSPMNGDGWRAVDALLVCLAERNPGLRVLFMGSGHWSVITSRLPLAESKGLFRFGSRLVENRFRRFGLP